MDHPSLVERLTNVEHVGLDDLDGLVARLRRRRAVAGLVVWASGAEGSQKPDSDLDLLLVLRTPELPFTFVTTWLGETLTELQVVSLLDLHAVGAGTEPATGWGPDLIIEALRGQILLDPMGAVATAARLVNARELSAPTAMEAFENWRHAQYNVRQTRRYLASSDPDARLAVEARLLYSFHFLLIHYFTVRRLRWRGDKEALRYWRQHEPALLADWRAALAEPDLDRKVARYEACFDRVYGPLGGPAPLDLDLVQPGSTLTGDDAPERAFQAWNDLISG